MAIKRKETKRMHICYDQVISCDGEKCRKKISYECCVYHDPILNGELKEILDQFEKGEWVEKNGKHYCKRCKEANHD